VRLGIPGACADRARVTASPSTSARASARTEESTPDPRYTGCSDVAEHRAEGGPAQHRQHDAALDAAQLVTAVPRGTQQPLADADLEPLDILEIAHQGTPTRA
jgi:hypothetical protein